MLVFIQKHVFETLDDERLLIVCNEPIAHQVDKKMVRISTDIFYTLTEGQRSLFLFQTFARHLGQQGVYGWFCHLEYLFAHGPFWNVVDVYIRRVAGEHSAEFFIQLKDLRDRMAEISLRNGRKVCDYFGEHMSDYPDLQHELEELDQTVTALFPELRAAIAKDIRKHPEQFVMWHH
ncbi:hypothetical protein NQ117_12970 [Paenibacillus sp. SC116]|uniref:hypothetical protein n=1 Tax=Paenibacillus sp. SC116 TaxID=2968986 RepID=UPI00215B56D2|nr:hypothetical protein [Paenibacillus sp. SC116]MCR8844596.1 hypothetical protein [Paenibacillus sp. SC116]